MDLASVLTDQLQALQAFAVFISVSTPKQSFLCEKLLQLPQAFLFSFSRSLTQLTLTFPFLSFPVEI
jgi:hypothetical protein